MEGGNAGLIGGLIGSVIGFAGGVIGTWCSIRNTRPGPERRYMIRMSIYGWLGLTAFLALVFLLPNPYRWLVWLPYPFLLFWAIRRCNAGLARIQADPRKSES